MTSDHPLPRPALPFVELVFKPATRFMPLTCVYRQHILIQPTVGAYSGPGLQGNKEMSRRLVNSQGVPGLGKRNCLLIPHPTEHFTCIFSFHGPGNSVCHQWQGPSSNPTLKNYRADSSLSSQGGKMSCYHGNPSACTAGRHR